MWELQGKSLVLTSSAVPTTISSVSLPLSFFLICNIAQARHARGFTPSHCQHGLLLQKMLD